MSIAPLAVAALLAAAPDAPAPGTSLTVYSSADPAGFDPRQFVQQQRMSGMDNVWGVPGYGVVKVVRTVAVPKGAGDVAFTASEKVLGTENDPILGDGLKILEFKDPLPASQFGSARFWRPRLTLQP